MAEKTVTWTEPQNKPFSRNTAPAQDEHAINGRKRYAVREQPTWINCKLSRPPQYKTNGHAIQSNVETFSQLSQAREPSDLSIRIASPRPPLTPKSNSTRAVSTITRLSDHEPSHSARSSRSQFSSNKSNILGLQDLVILGDNELNERNKGRDVLKKKVEESGIRLSVTPESYYYQSSNTDIDIKSKKQPSSLKRFRISSAESTHRSPDVSIGLRHIATLLRGQEVESNKKISHRRRSTSTLLSLTKITSNNIQRTRRQSEPVILSTSHLRDLGMRTPAPGEGYLQQRRRSSLSAPATMGTESNSPSKNTYNAKRKTRPLPQAYSSSHFADREWRPPTLQKFSIKPPWAPSQQTPRYFPKYSNLQDIHCRNPYLVPGSILYKSSTLLE